MRKPRIKPDQPQTFYHVMSRVSQCVFNLDIEHDPEIKEISLAKQDEYHCDLAVQAMEKGKDVFVEKPMALSADDAKKMQAVAFQTNKVLSYLHIIYLKKEKNKKN